jgi:ABC-2 type transport system permease protein
VLTRLRVVLDKRAILWTLVRRDLHVRYAESVLGYLWTILDPLLMAGVYFVVFDFIFKAHRVAGHPYFLFLLIGLLAWQWFNGGTSDTARSLLQEARLVRSTNLPRELWVIRVVLAKGIEFLLSLPILLGFTIFYMVKGQASLDIELLYFPLGIVLQTVLLIGIGLLLAPITVLATDTQRVVRIVLRFLFYLTPVLYDVRAVPAKLRWALELNPMTGVLEMYRGGFFDSRVDLKVLSASVVGTAIIFVLGYAVFRRTERSVLKEI